MVAVISVMWLMSVGFTSESSEDKVNKRVIAVLDSMANSANEWVNSSRVTSPENYKQIRSLYKSIEAYVCFRYPVIEKNINGGPVPGVVSDFITLQEETPHGLQVIEELITSDPTDSVAIIGELNGLHIQIGNLKKSFEQWPLKTWEIIEAQHLVVSRVISLGITGFDSPVFLLGMQDAAQNLKGLRQDLQGYSWLGDVKLHQKLMTAIQLSLMELTKGGDFNGFDRLSWIRNQLIPLQVAIRTWQFSSDIEKYEETGSTPRAISTQGKHLFDVNYLDPYFTTRGGANSGFELNKLQVELGKKLFFDVRLSKTGNMSCGTCHKPQFAYADSVAKSFSRNSPSLYNVGFQGNFFWDLRSDDINNQIHHVVHHPQEFNTNSSELVKKLSDIPEYSSQFQAIFKEKVSYSNIKMALEQYLRSLISYNSRFDRYVRGEKGVKLTSSEKRGANLFLGKAACATCHFAPLFNGYVPPHYGESEGEILGVLESPNSKNVDADFGRYELFKSAYPNADFVKGMFKTPGIRNIQHTAPYMHNGSYETLDEVMEFYNSGGALGKGIQWPQQTLSGDSLGLSNPEIQDIISFMKSLEDMN